VEQVARLGATPLVVAGARVGGHSKISSKAASKSVSPNCGKWASRRS
jgi:hypothetical protein